MGDPFQKYKGRNLSKTTATTKWPISGFALNSISETTRPNSMILYRKLYCMTLYKNGDWPTTTTRSLTSWFSVNTFLLKLPGQIQWNFLGSFLALPLQRYNRYNKAFWLNNSNIVDFLVCFKNNTPETTKPNLMKLLWNLPCMTLSKRQNKFCDWPTTTTKWLTSCFTFRYFWNIIFI